MNVLIPTPLRSYTQEKGEVAAEGKTLGELLTDLDRHYPGIRFRIIDEQNEIRRHIRIFVNQKEAELNFPITSQDQVQIICALSGG